MISNWAIAGCVFAGLLAIFILAVIFIRVYARATCGYFRESVRLDGKTVIITGANGGVGKETTRELASRGARVIMACRNLETGRAVRDEIMESTKNSNVILKKLDLSSQKSIREFAEDILNTEPRLDVLIHNAAIIEFTYGRSEDDLEITMATNQFGPFLLTHLLIDLLKKSAPSRIVVVASVSYLLATLNLDKLNPPSFWYPPYLYFVSKYANISFTFELARRLNGTNVTANCLHPGLIGTGIWKGPPFPISWILKLLMVAFFKTPEQGCQTTVYLACSKKVENVSGKYFSDCKESTVTRGASDPVKGKRLWELCEKFSNLKPTEPKI